jgi:hypothetical protein
MPLPLVAPLISVFGKKGVKKVLFSGKSGKSGKTPGLNIVKPSKSQTNWILIISIIAFVFAVLVFLTYSLIEDFDGGMSRPKISKSKNISKKEKALINKRTNEYTFGRNVKPVVLLEGFIDQSGKKAFSPDPFETIPYIKALRVPQETNYSAIKGRAHTKIDKKDNDKQLKYNLLKKRI